MSFNGSFTMPPKTLPGPTSTNLVTCTIDQTFSPFNEKFGQSNFFIIKISFSGWEVTLFPIANQGF